jgi:hypothetical protein
MPPHFAPASLAAALFLIACGGSDNSASHNPDALFQPWTLGAPAARIGGAEDAGGVQLTSVTHAVALDGDSLLLVDSREPLVMVFDPDGRKTHQIGRRGEGPGEFRYIAALGRLADSIWIADSPKRRVQFMGLSGDTRSARPLPSASVSTAPGRVSFFRGTGMLHNGLMAGFIGLRHDHPDRPEPPPHGDSGMLALFDTDSTVRDTLMWIVQAPASLMLDVPPNLHFPGPNYFADSPLWHIARDGSGAVVVERTVAADSANAQYRVTRWNGDGERMFAVDVHYNVVALPPGLEDTVVNRLADDIKEYYPSLEMVRGMVRDTLRAPRFFPPAASVLIATGGSIWIARDGVNLAGFEPRRYDILDPTGKPAGTITLDRPGKLLAATATSVWIVETDADDVPTVLRLPILERRR